MDAKIHSKVLQAIRKGAVDPVETLINETEPSTLVKLSPTTNQSSWLHLAAKHGQVEIVKILLWRFDVNSLTTNTRNEKTPLMIAIEQNQPETVEFLLSRGAKMTIPREDDYEELFARACEEGHNKMVKVLLQHGIPIYSQQFAPGDKKLAQFNIIYTFCFQ